MTIILARPGRLATALLFGLLAGCAVGPDFRPPAAPTAAGYAPASSAAPATPADTSQRLQPGGDVAGQWWQAFGSPQLDALVARALAHSPNLDAAQAALRAAVENVRAQRGAYLPTVDASLASSRQQTGQQLSSGVADNQSLYTLSTGQLSVSYTLDLWGANRRQVESLQAQADEQRFQLEAAYQTLTAQVANAVITAASLDAQLQLGRAIVEEQQQLLASTIRQQALGDVAATAVAAQRAALAQAQAALAPLQLQRAQQGDLLAALVGDTPDQPRPPLPSLQALHLPASLPLSLPAALVAQRPDVQQAEAAMHAASAQIGVAEAARLPSLQIDASLGSAAGGVGSLFKSGGGFWSLGGTLGQTLFDGGALKHRQRAAQALYRQAAAQYRSTVLAALQNVADTLQAIEADGRAAQAADAAAQAGAQTLAVNRRQQRLGDVSADQLLLAQIAQQQAEQARIQADAQRFSDTVALFQALGGGWWHRHDVAALP